MLAALHLHSYCCIKLAAPAGSSRRSGPNILVFPLNLGSRFIAPLAEGSVRIFTKMLTVELSYSPRGWLI
ncbi:hypothetical protein BN77_2553 [Rhizobium mesoamericanum STM3625]|uniref:Uncharacterized protein n=1 Tax=Rhizobium mesoamericanum STM3625 TaxID=1211777 RepID=K0PV81_9HYPH|nr:hypothetical protein BN77_2553 [Rhizobium mesoamericanum STM3625]